MEIDGKCGKHRKPRSTENIGNVRIGLGANITTERGGKHRKTMENIGKVRIGTGANITMKRGGKRRKTTENIGKVGIGTGGKYGT